MTPEKKRQSKVQAKEELKSSNKKMADKDFKKFLEQVQAAGVASEPMPLMSEKASVKKASALAGSKRTASKAVTQKASATQGSKRSKK